MRLSKTLFFLVFLVFAGGAYGQPLFNTGFESGTSAWYPTGGSLSTSTTTVFEGSQAARLTSRTAFWNGIAQSLIDDLQPGNNYRFTARLYADTDTTQLHKITVAQTDDSGTNYISLASVTAPGSAWRILTGTLAYEPNGVVTELQFYAEGPEPGIDLYLDGVTAEDLGDGSAWIDAANARIESIRKRDVEIRVENLAGEPIEGASVDIAQQSNHFAFGSAINNGALNVPQYTDFFAQHFEWAVPEYEAKWPACEPSQGFFDYAPTDAVVGFCTANGIRMRGHTIFWAVDQFVQGWVQALDDTQLQQRMTIRLQDVIDRYAGDFEHWDVNNEMLHGSFYADRLGDGIRTWMFQQAELRSPETMFFVNDYNVVSGPETGDYVQQIQDLIADGAPVEGIGAQGHFYGAIDAVGALDRLDTLATLGLPIWITELDVGAADENVRADRLESAMRACFSHPAVEGILLWGFWADRHWRGADSALIDSDWTINAAGQRYLALRDAWSTEASVATDANGVATFRPFHGTFAVDISTPNGAVAQALLDVPPGPDPLVVTLVVEDVCPPDRNGDGVNDIIDLLDFLSSFFAQDVAGADLTGDGSVLIEDLLLYLSLWFMGC